MNSATKKTVLWVYDEGRAYPEPQVHHLRAYLHVDVIPVSSTFQAINILRSCDGGTISFVVTCLVRKEFGTVINNAGVSLIAAVRAFDATIPIALFSTVAYTNMLPGTRFQAYAAAGGSPDDGLFEVVENTNALINFLAKNGAPRILSSHDTKLPATGDKMTSDSGTEYEIGQKLGEGSYAWVFECKDTFGQAFVAKIQKPERAKQIVEADWKKEQAFLKSLNHPNIVNLYESFIHNNLYYYILERAECNLRSLMRSEGITRDQVMGVVPQLLSGVAHIHRNRIIHRDLQVDNILISYDSEGGLIAKISDFGISKLLHSSDTSTVGTTGRPIDLPPEVLSTGTSTFLSDLYQVGLVFYQMYVGSHPITDKAVTESDASEASTVPPQHQYDAISAGQPAAKAEAIGDAFGSCIARMLHVNPAMRYPTAGEAWKDIRKRCTLSAPSLRSSHGNGGAHPYSLNLRKSHPGQLQHQMGALGHDYAALPASPQPHHMSHSTMHHHQHHQLQASQHLHLPQRSQSPHSAHAIDSGEQAHHMQSGSSHMQGLRHTHTGMSAHDYEYDYGEHGGEMAVSASPSGEGFPSAASPYQSTSSHGS